MIASLRNSDLFFILYLLQYMARALISLSLSIMVSLLVRRKCSSLYVECLTEVSELIGCKCIK